MVQVQLLSLDRLVLVMPTRRRSSRLKSLEKAKNGTENFDSELGGSKLTSKAIHGDSEMSDFGTGQGESGSGSEGQGDLRPDASAAQMQGSSPSVTSSDTSPGLSRQEFAVPDSVHRDEAPGRPEKVKSRWRRWSEAEAFGDSGSQFHSPPAQIIQAAVSSSSLETPEAVAGEVSEAEAQAAMELFKDNMVLKIPRIDDEPRSGDSEPSSSPTKDDPPIDKMEGVPKDDLVRAPPQPKKEVLPYYEPILENIFLSER